MPTRALEGLVLGKRPPSESFQQHTVFSIAEGTVRVQQRVPKKPTATHVPLDLFDEASFVLEGARDGGTTWFVKEVRLIHREPDLGRSYEALTAASQLAALVARNNVPEESRESVYALLKTVFTTLAAGGRPDVVYLKSLYCFARDEGYPLKQEWFPTLLASDRTAFAAVLNRPVAKQTSSAAEVASLQDQLERYLRGRTEVLLD